MDENAIILGLLIVIVFILLFSWTKYEELKSELEYLRKFPNTIRQKKKIDDVYVYLYKKLDDLENSDVTLSKSSIFGDITISYETLRKIVLWVTQEISNAEIIVEKDVQQTPLQEMLKNGGKKIEQRMFN